MVYRNDCEHFGIHCLGIVPPREFKDSIDSCCAMFKTVQWRHELHKPAGRSLL